MCQESSLKSGENQELYMQNTFYQGDASETSTFHKPSHLSRSSKGQLFLQGHENMVSRAEATPVSTQQCDLRKYNCHIQQRAQILRQVSVSETGVSSSQNVNLQLRSGGRSHGQVPAPA